MIREQYTVKRREWKRFAKEKEHKLKYHAIGV